MPRRKKQHLTQRPDGRYLCRYKGICFYGYTEDEALTARDEYKKQLSYGKPETFSDYAARWLSAYKGHLIDESYNEHVRTINRFTEAVDDKPMHKYTQTDIAKYYQTFVGKSASYGEKARLTVCGIFRAAYADGLIQREPTINIKPPKGYRGTHRAITPEERAIIHTLQHRFRPAIMTMLYAGLRRGEVAALNVQRDVDFTRKTITIREAIYFDPQGQRVSKLPKTEAGIRTIPLLDILARELKGIKGLVCTSAKGKPITEKAFSAAMASYNNAVNKMRKSPGINIRPHDLRHSFCTMLYDAGVDIKSAMLWMGHADQHTTMMIYTHLTETRRTEAEKALREAEKSLISSQLASQTVLQIPDSLDK